LPTLIRVGSHILRLPSGCIQSISHNQGWAVRTLLPQHHNPQLFRVTHMHPLSCMLSRCSRYRSNVAGRWNLPPFVWVGSLSGNIRPTLHVNTWGCPSARRPTCPSHACCCQLWLGVAGCVACPPTWVLALLKLASCGAFCCCHTARPTGSQWVSSVCSATTRKTNCNQIFVQRAPTPSKPCWAWRRGRWPKQPTPATLHAMPNQR